MKATSVITARIDPDTLERLDSLANKIGRSRSSLLAEAVRAFVEEQTAFYEFVEVGERDIDEGRFYNREQMDQWFAERIAEARARRDRAEAA